MKKVQLKLLNLSLISALCFLVSPRISVAKSSALRKLDNNQQLTCGEKLKEEGKKEEISSGLDILEVEEFHFQVNKFSKKKIAIHSILFDRAISYFDSGLSPPSA
jgi:hypothetical protein